ncbi:MAG: ECF transporter S component, partial [Solobacterium sp.]|nr:ECF transporter S component [Solobacterium sp.]
MKKLTLKELILCGNLAVLGLICKPLFSPLFNLLTDFIRIPGGSATAGISILFLVFAAALIRKPAAGLLTGFVQGVCSLASGISAAAGVLVLITYSIPGMAIDL